MSKQKAVNLGLMEKYLKCDSDLAPQCILTLRFKGTFKSGALIGVILLKSFNMRQMLFLSSFKF